jgi:hypothetical protein
MRNINAQETEIEEARRRIERNAKHYFYTRKFIDLAANRRLW